MIQKQFDLWVCYQNLQKNKKVLLRERKRHTARKRAQDGDPPRQLDLTPPPPRQLDLTPPPLAAGPDPPRQLDLTPLGWT